MTAIKPTQAPWLLSTPALVLYATFLIAPLASVFLISFFNFEFYGGIQVSFSLNNYLEILTDSYYYEVFARTFGVALAVTLACVVLGTAEAYVIRASPDNCVDNLRSRGVFKIN